MPFFTNIFSKIKYFVNYLHYMNSSMHKNLYPCRLIGQVFEPTNNDVHINFKFLGKHEFYIYKLKEVLDHPKFIELFNPDDGVQLGILSFKEIILNLPSKLRITLYTRIKTKMLELDNIKYVPIKIDEEASDQLEKLYSLNCMPAKNVYYCKLLGGKKTELPTETKVIYSIFGKREAYEAKLVEIINDKELVSKFHPADAVKLGFIATGDRLLKKLHT